MTIHHEIYLRSCVLTLTLTYERDNWNDLQLESLRVESIGSESYCWQRAERGDWFLLADLMAVALIDWDAVGERLFDLGAAA